MIRALSTMWLCLATAFDAFVGPLSGRQLEQLKEQQIRAVNQEHAQ